MVRGNQGARGSLVSVGGEPGPTHCPWQTQSPWAARKQGCGLGSPWHPGHRPVACWLLQVCCLLPMSWLSGHLETVSLSSSLLLLRFGDKS